MKLLPAVARPRPARLAHAIVLTLGLVPAVAGAQAFCVDADGNLLGSASDADAVACGVDALAAGAGSTAIGAHALAEGDNSAAFGAYSWAGGGNSTALGAGTFALGENSTASGFNAAAIGANASAYGYGAVAEGADSAAIGTGSTAAGASSSAFGAGSTASGTGSLALGGASASADNAAAIGSAATANAVNAMAIGTGGMASGVNSIALGMQSVASGGSTTAIGDQAWATTKYGVAIGPVATATGYLPLYANTNVVRSNTRTNATGQVAIGFASAAQGYNAVALGANAKAYNDNAVAIGNWAGYHQSFRIEPGVGANSIAIGYSAVAPGSNNTVVGQKAFTSYYAQTKAPATIFGEYLFTANGTAIGSAAAASQTATALGTTAGAGGVQSLAIGANAVVQDAMPAVRPGTGGDPTAAGYTPDSLDFSGMKSLNSAAMGFGARVQYAANAMALGPNAKVAGTPTGIGSDNSIALGFNSVVNAATPNAMALGAGSNASFANSVALGAGSRTTVGALSNYTDGSGRLGAQNSIGEVSVGSVGGERQVTNVAAGKNGTDAVNVNQLNAATTELGQGLANVGTRIDGVQDRVDQIAQGVSDAGVRVDAVEQGLADANARIDDVDGRLGNVESDIDSLRSATGQIDMISVDGNGDGSDKASAAAGSKAVAMGSAAGANGANGIAIGNSAFAAGPNDTALGGNARVEADGSTAVGANATIAAAATNAVAVGESASVQAASGTALGQGATVDAAATGAVAIGQGSLADRASTVSVGTAGGERQVVNVAAGTADTDAANVAQVRSQATQTLSQANAYTDSRLQAFDDDFNLLRARVDERFDRQDHRIDQQGAMSAAMLNMATSAAGIRTQNRVGVGVGFQNGASAVSIGYQRALSDRATVTVGGAASSDDTSVGAGVGFGW